MPLNPQAKAVLDKMAEMGLPPRQEQTPHFARTNSATPPDPGPDVAKVEDRDVPGPAGGVPVRIYTPQGSGPFPLLMWYHGGGWVVGSRDSVDGTCRRMCVGAGAVVVSVDYRLAPEHKFPAAADDCYAATVWAANNAASLNADSSRLAVGGESAGGNLAAVVPLMARDKGGPAIVYQLMVYPVTERNFNTASYSSNADGYGLTHLGMAWYWDHYMAQDSDAENPYAAPMKAADLSGLPSAMVITAEYDPLRDEGEAYAARLQAAGVPTVCTRYDGQIHLFYALPNIIDDGKKAVAQACEGLKAAFAGQPVAADD
jgi:acetyl esterase